MSRVVELLELVMERQERVVGLARREEAVVSRFVVAEGRVRVVVECRNLARSGFVYVGGRED